MGLKDLLVHVDHDPAGESRAAVAIALAVEHEAHLTGLHVMAWPPFSGYVDVQMPSRLIDEQRRLVDERARQAEERFREQARRHGLHAEWRVGEGDLVGTVKLHARYADLTVLGQGVDLENASGDLAFLPGDVVLGVGRPVLIVPRYGTFERIGAHVVVAWNGSREATRAVNDAIPLLKRATKVTVLAVDPEDGPRPRVPGGDIALHLARHGIATEAASTSSADIGVGDVLLSRAADLGADLIVMGAYGHSRMREMVLGGATRHLLQHMTVPVLMSH